MIAVDWKETSHQLHSEINVGKVDLPPLTLKTFTLLTAEEDNTLAVKAPFPMFSTDWMFQTKSDNSNRPYICPSSQM